MPEKDADATTNGRLPVREKLPGHPGVWRHYRAGDTPGKPTGSYYAEVMLGWKIDAKGQRVKDRARVTGDTLAELKNRLEDEKGKRQQGLARGRKAQSVADYLRRWLADKYALVDLTPDDFTIEKFRPLARERIAPGQYKTAIRYHLVIEADVIPAIGAHILTELQPEHIQPLINTLAAKGKRRAAKYVAQTLSAALRAAIRRRLLAWNPMTAVTVPSYRPKSGAKDPLTAGEIAAFLDAADGAQDPLRALWALSIGTGCRPGELLGLHRDDVDVADPHHASITIRQRLIAAHDRTPIFADDTKTGAAANGRLAIDSDTAGYLITHLNAQAQARERPGERYVDYGLVFCTESGVPLIHRNVVRAFKAALQRAGLAHDVTFYSLRHAHATLILEATHDLKAVQRRLRHSNLSVLSQTYAHVTEAMDGEVANTVGATIRRRRRHA